MSAPGLISRGATPSTLWSGSWSTLAKAGFAFTPATGPDCVPRMLAPGPTLSLFAKNAMPFADRSPATTLYVNSSVVVFVRLRPVSKVMDFSPESSANWSFSTGLPVTFTAELNVTRARTVFPGL